MTRNERRKRIAYVQYTNPGAFPPLERSSQILAKAGWDVLFLGAEFENVADLVLNPHQSIHCELLPSARLGKSQKLRYLRFCLWVFFRLLRWRPDWIYASDFFSVPIALLSTWFPSVYVLYHEHDAPSLEVRRGAYEIISRMRTILPKRADILVAPNCRRAELLAEQGGIPAKSINIVWNSPSQAEAESLLTSPSKDDESFYIYFHGSISSARVPTSLIYALKELPSFVQLRLIGYETIGSVGYIRQLQALAAQIGCEDRVEYLGALPHSQLLWWTGSSHLGLNLFANPVLSQNEQSMAGASNKAFEYLIGGIPFLVTAGLSDWYDMFVVPGFALPCDPNDPSSIADAVFEVYSNPTKWRRHAMAGRKKIIEEWNYETQFAPVLSKLSRGQRERV